MKKIDVVGAVIVNDKQEILCALRSQQMFLGGYWEFPGGKIEPGEQPEESLAREIQEELGCEVEVGQLVEDIVYEYSSVIVHLTTYLAQIVTGAPVAKEHQKLVWLQKHELRTLNWAPADLPTVDKLLADDFIAVPNLRPHMQHLGGSYC